MNLIASLRQCLSSLEDAALIVASAIAALAQPVSSSCLTVAKVARPSHATQAAARHPMTVKVVVASFIQPLAGVQTLSWVVFMTSVLKKQPPMESTDYFREFYRPKILQTFLDRDLSNL